MNILRSPLMRAILVVLLLASIPVYVLQYTLIPQSGDYGVSVNLGDDWTALVTSVEPGSAAARAGIRIGDTLSVPADQHTAFVAPARGQRDIRALHETMAKRSA